MKKPSKNELNKLPASIRGDVAGLFHEYKTNRYYAAGALREKSHSAAIPYLVNTTLKDLFADVRMNTVRTLGEIGHPSAVPHLIKALEVETEVDTVKEGITQALGKIRENMLKEKPKFDKRHPNYALLLINPATHPNSFLRLHKDLQDRAYAGKDEKWWYVHAKQLKQKEGNLKRVA